MSERYTLKSVSMLDQEGIGPEDAVYDNQTNLKIHQEDVVDLLNAQDAEIQRLRAGIKRTGEMLLLHIGAVRLSSGAVAIHTGEVLMEIHAALPKEAP